MMVELAKWLEGGGAVMYLLLLGLMPMVLMTGLLHLIAARRWSLAWLTLGLVLTFATGAITTQAHRSRVREALAMAYPQEKLQLAIAGYREANRPLRFALLIVVAGLLPFTAGEIRRARRQSK
jgi:hypothetical protein